MTTETAPEEPQKKDRFFQKFWRPALAFSYIIICLFDFIVMPAIVEANNVEKGNLVEIAESINKINDAAQVKAIEVVLAPREWEPKTLDGGAFFHIAMLSILTGAAITRGMEKVEREKHRN